MKSFSTIHLVWGTIFLVVFLATGWYMKTGFPALYHGDDAVRLLYRSSHIYILLSALLNLSLYRRRPRIFGGVRKAVDAAASLLLLASSLLFLRGFVLEAATMNLHRPATFWGVVSVLSGILVKLLLEFLPAPESEPPSA
ncbi:MAG: hypothetical protein H6686_00305 [Fibrobacteria bacterium]|nr:hypothetical protein [Fibrobacteria bacterium]